MISIIDYFKKNDLSYTATSSPADNFPPNNAFSRDDDTYFYTVQGDIYWQIMFQKPVTIEKYFITCPTKYGEWITSWRISHSLDCSSFNQLQDDAKKLQGNTENFTLKNPVYCKCFKISGLTTTRITNGLWFNSFDCFGSITSSRRTRNGCTCNCNFAKRRLISNVLSFLFVLNIYS